MTVERDFATVETAVSDSTELWARDLQALFEHARDRFGDVSWETELGSERIWGHKAVIYARAPKAFKDRYFVSTSSSRTPTLRTPSPSASFLAPPIIDSRATTPPSSFRHPSEHLSAPSRASVHSTLSNFTVRAPGENILRLPHGDTPELFQAQLEWLYTGEGFADVVEWISEDDNVRSIRDSLGRHGSQDERRDKLGQDLTYMWRSKLYVDVRIHLAPLVSDDKESDSDDSTDSLSSTSVFTAHRFILVSRSPYFSSLLLNHSAFRPASGGGIGDIHLPTPPFTPASLHFCLGWMYAGHLDFSNRSFDLGTAFQIHRAAAYLQLSSLVAEIESRIVWDFCHGLDVSRCRCKKCSNRVARIWRFVTGPEVSSIELKERTRRYMVRLWGDCWGRDVGSLDDEARREVVADVVQSVTWRNVAVTYKAIIAVRGRLETALRTKGGSANWVDQLADMVDMVEQRAQEVLVQDFDRIADGNELWALLQGKGFSDDVLEEVLKQLVDALGMPQYCQAGPRAYQTLVSSILLKVHPDTLETILASRSIGRHRVEAAKSGILGHIRRRWLQIRDAGGFAALENWSIKEIADEIEVDVDELFEMSISPAPSKHTPMITRAGIPRTMSQSASLHQASTLTLGSGRPSTARIRPAIPSDMRDRVPSLGEAATAGLRRLRLSSSASTASRISVRTVTTPSSGGLAAAGPSRDSLRIRAVSGSPTAIPQGPRARSPTAERAGKRISIGPAARRPELGRPIADHASGSTSSRRESGGANKRDSQVLSGPLRQLMAKGSIGSASGSTLTATAAGHEARQAGQSSSAVAKDKGKGREVDAPPTPGPSARSGAAQTSKRSGTSETTNAATGRGVKGKERADPPPSSPKKAASIASVRSTRTIKSQASGVAGRREGTTEPDPMPAGRGAGRQAATNGQAAERTATRLVPAAAKATTEAGTPRSRLTPTVTVGSARSVAPSTRARMSSAATVRSAALTRDKDSAESTGKTAARPVVRNAAIAPPQAAATPSTAKTARTPTLSPARSVPDLKKATPTIASAARMVRPRVSSGVTTSPGKPRVALGPSSLAVPATGSVAAIRSRTASQATTASARITAPSAATGTARGKVGAVSPLSAAESRGPSAPTRAAEVPRSRLTSQASAVSSSSRPGTIRSSRPPAPTAMPTLHPPPMRSASASTAEETEARTPRSSDQGVSSVIIRKSSEYTDEPSVYAPFPPAAFRPMSMSGHRDVSGSRKASAGSTRSQASMWRQHPANAFDPPKRVEQIQQEEMPLPEGVKAFKGPGISLKVGIPCIVNLNMDGRRGRFKARVKYIGFMAQSKGPWIGIETDSLDRLNVITLPAGVQADTHYFHFTSPESGIETGGREQEVQHEQRMQRQRRIEQIRMGLREREGLKVGMGGTAPKARHGSLGVGMGYPGKGPAASRATSPYVGHAADVEWVSGDLRALFVRPSEVVYVVGAE